MSDKKYRLKLSAQAKESKILLAPKKGEMNTQIKEALSGKLRVELIDKSSNCTLYKDDSENASMEIVD